MMYAPPYFALEEIMEIISMKYKNLVINAYTVIVKQKNYFRIWTFFFLAIMVQNYVF